MVSDALKSQRNCQPVPNAAPQEVDDQTVLTTWVKDKSRRLTDSKTPRFLGTNWESWRVATEIHLDACGLLHYLMADSFPVGNGLDAQYHREADGMLRSYFASRVTDDIIIMLQGCHTAMDMWRRLHKKYGNVTEGEVDRLYKTWTDMEQEESQSITSYMTQIEILHAKLESVGKVLSDKDKRKKLVAGLGDAWWNIKQVLDLSYNDLSYEEAGSRLLQVEAKMKPRKQSRGHFELNSTEQKLQPVPDSFSPKHPSGQRHDQRPFHREDRTYSHALRDHGDHGYALEANATDWKNYCGRCGRPGHDLSACPKEGKYDKQGEELRQCFNCSSTDHESRECPQRRGPRRLGGPRAPYATHRQQTPLGPPAMPPAYPGTVMTGPNGTWVMSTKGTWELGQGQGQGLRQGQALGQPESNKAVGPDSLQTGDSNNST
jgi:hypothetical protein